MVLRGGVIVKSIVFNKYIRTVYGWRMARFEDLAQLDLNLLYTFRQVAELGSVGEAARRLGRTQPAISARLRQLEHEIGAPLFERAGRGLALSPVGRAVAAEVREALQAVHHVVDRARAAARAPTGTLRIGALPTVATYLLASHTAAFLRMHPTAGVSIKTKLTTSQIDALLDGKLDLVFSVGPPPHHQRLQVVRLGEVRPVLVRRRGAAPKLPRRPSARDLERLPLIGFGLVGDLFFDAVWAFLERHGLRERLRMLVPHIQALKALVLAGAGATILPDYTAREAGLVACPVAGLDVAHAVWVALRSTSRGLPLVQGFLDGLAPSVRAALE